MNMRRSLGRLVGGCIGVLALLAVNPPADAQVPPDVLVVGQIAEPKSMDPHVVTAVNDFRILVNVYDGLVRYKPGTLEVEPALATDWQISEDGLTYTFQLRDGVSFHDGTPVQRRGGQVQLRPHARREPRVPRHRAVPAVVLLLIDRGDRGRRRDDRGAASR